MVLECAGTGAVTALRSGRKTGLGSPLEVRRAACAEHQTRSILTEALGEPLAMSLALCEVQS